VRCLRAIVVYGYGFRPTGPHPRRRSEAHERAGLILHARVPNGVNGVSGIAIEKLRGVLAVVGHFARHVVHAHGFREGVAQVGRGLKHQVHSAAGRGD
jgi:hypothetical protein